MAPSNWSLMVVLMLVTDCPINQWFCYSLIYLKVEYDANENPLKNSEKIADVGQRLMYLIIKK